jgi:MinD-like ATPase involved in chromosome partitioning or flagellar assembly
MAADGLRVGVMDTDFQTPGVFHLFGIQESDFTHTLNDYVWGRCALSKTVYDLKPRYPDLKGALYLIPASPKQVDVARINREKMDIAQLNDGLYQACDDLELDVLLVDTHSGLGDEPLLMLAICDCVLIVMRPDVRDIQGTAVVVEVARKLDAPRFILSVNQTPHYFDFADVKAQMEKTYRCEVGVVMPYSDEMMGLGGSSVFARRYPSHTITLALRHLMNRLLT